MTKLKIASGRRGVSPIIATLMLVAITVVGGILIFVFSQGFFNTNQVTSTAAPEQVTITAWNFTKPVASATSGMNNPNGGQMYGIGSTLANSTIGAGDWTTVTIRNTGTQQVVVSKVTVNGIVYVAGTGPITAGVPGTFSDSCTGCYGVTDGGTSAGATPTLKNTIAPGKEVSIVLKHGGTGWVPIKIGKPVAVTIATGAGNQYVITAVAGSSSS